MKRIHSDESSKKGQGEWNVLEALCVNGEFKIKLNGKVTVEAEEPTPRAGAIMLQFGKGAIEFRRLEVRDSR